MGIIFLYMYSLWFSLKRACINTLPKDTQRSTWIETLRLRIGK